MQTKDGVLSAQILPPPSLLSSPAATCLALPVRMSHSEASLSGLLNQFKYHLMGYRWEWNVKDAPGAHPTALGHGHGLWLTGSPRDFMPTKRDKSLFETPKRNLSDGERVAARMNTK